MRRPSTSQVRWKLWSSAGTPRGFSRTPTSISFAHSTGHLESRKKIIIEIVRRPDAIISEWIDDPNSAKGVTVVEMREGTVDDKAMFAIALTGYPYKGSFKFKDSGPIAFDASEDAFKTAFPDWQVIKTGDSAWTIEKELEGVYTLAEGDFDLSNLFVYKGFTGELVLTSSNLFKSFLAAGALTITSTLHIKHLSETLYLGPITLTKDVLNAASSGPNNFNNDFYTKAQIDANFPAKDPVDNSVVVGTIAILGDRVNFSSNPLTSTTT